MNEFRKKEQPLIKYVMETLNIDKENIAYNLIRSVVANTIYELDCQGYINHKEVEEHIKLGYLANSKAKGGTINEKESKS